MRGGAPSTRGPAWIVGIGASAGGVEALRELLPVLPGGDVAYVVAQHMSPVHPSLLMQVLARETALDVAEIVNGLELARGVVYVAPPNCDVELMHGAFVSRQAAPRISPQPSIDVLFESLADHARDSAIGIVLSGTGADGVTGVEAISAAGGRTLAQEPTSARYRDMPQAAIDSGSVEFVVPPAAMGEVLRALLAGDSPARRGGRFPGDAAMAMLARETRRVTGWDIASYKDGTLGRQLTKRVASLGLSTLEDYLAYTQDHPEELTELRDSMLITVTGFFRDRGSFSALQASLQPLVAAKPMGEPLRAWVAGCATGEEAYSIAIVLSELARERGHDNAVKVFATDISDAAMEVARRGSYPSASLMEIPEDVVRRYFVVEGERASVSKKLRDTLVIARQDVTRDPPLVRMDLVSCRNLLIYLIPSVQERVLANLHAALNPRGLLFLGRSESIPVESDLFSTVSAGNRVFQRLAATSSPALGSPVYPRLTAPAARRPPARVARDAVRDDVRDRLLLDFGPPSVLVDATGTPVHQIGDVSRFLTLPDVGGDYRITDMVVPALRTEVSTLLGKIAREGSPMAGHTVVLRDVTGQAETMRLEVRRIDRSAGHEPFTLISFIPQDGPVPAAHQARAEDAADRGMSEPGEDVEVEALEMRVLVLEHELEGTREHLQAVVEELESSNEELQAMNEELQASSEELQATNEELETTNEELQATNEELTTVNETLEVRSDELAATNIVLHNIQSSAHSAIVLVDRDIRLVSFSPLAVKIFGVVADDIGSRLATLPNNLALDDLPGLVQRVIETGHGEILETASRTNGYLLSVMPYVDEDKIEGAVLALSDITELVAARRELLRRAEELSVLAEVMPNVVYRASLDMSTVHFLSTSVVDVLGVEVEAATADPSLLVTGVELDGDDPVVFDQPLANWHRDYRVRRPDGRLVVVRHVSHTVPDPSGRPAYRVGTLVEITDLRAAMVDAERQRRRAEAIFARGRAPMITMTGDGTIIAVNSYAADVLGWEPALLAGRSLPLLVRLADRPAVAAAIERARDSGSGRVPPCQVARIDGQRRLVTIDVTAITLPSTLREPEQSFLLASLRDVTDEENVRGVLLAHEAQWQAVFDGTAVAMFVLSREGVITQANDALGELLEYAPQSLIGRHIRDVTHPDDAADDMALLSDVLRGIQDRETTERRYLTSAGRVVWGRLMVSRAPATDPADGLVVIGTIVDLTSERLREEAAIRMAQSDALTGLPNRATVFDRLRQAILRAARNGEQLSVLFVDLDGFKDINDEHGHDVGDVVLSTVADRLRLTVRASDSVARIGGDEFLVIAPHERGESPHEGIRLADRVVSRIADPIGNTAGAAEPDRASEPSARIAERVLRHIQRPIDLPADASLAVTASVGVAQFPGDGADVEDLVRKADLAMYAAKRRGGNRVRFYSERLQEGARRRADQRRAILSGLQQGQFQPFFQPVVDAASTRVVALEILARWRDPERGLLVPLDFLDLMSDLGNLDELTAAMVLRARELRPRLLELDPAVSLSLNIDPTQLLDGHIVDRMRDLVGDDLSGWTIEVTEASAFGREPAMVDALGRLRRAGARTSLDDFGTGYSSVLHLKTFAFDEVKIDREFVCEPGEEGGGTLVTAMVGMAHALGAAAVAEGVETAAQAALMRDLGVDRLQGYLFAEPMSGEEALAWMTQQAAKNPR